MLTSSSFEWWRQATNTIFIVLLGVVTLVPTTTTTALSLSSSSTESSLRRTFEFVEYGQSLDTASSLNARRTTTITCDGRVAGATLELTHWTGNTTPDEWYADTSTEMALRLPADVYADAVVVNNHFDTDGVLSVWATLEPHEARKYQKLLCDAAAAGDFSEWTSDAGLQVDAVLEGLAAQQANDAEAYRVCLQELPRILEDIDTNKGRGKYCALWEPTLQAVHDGYAAWQRGEVTLEQQQSSSLSNLHLVVCREGGETTTNTNTNTNWLPRPVLHRALVEQGYWSTAHRILRVQLVDQQQSMFRYEKPGHGWVSKLVERPVIPGLDTADALVQALNAAEQLNNNNNSIVWKRGGDSLVSICQTTTPSSLSVEQVVALVNQWDDTTTTLKKESS